MQNPGSYEKIKNLVELNDDILAVFIVDFSGIKNYFVAESSRFESGYIDSVYNEIKDIVKERKFFEDNIVVGSLKWSMFEFKNIRVLKLYEKENTIVVLIRSNTQLEYTVDNILGYYYEEEDEPKSLF